jgi:dolichol-phosphate mannosyltransferase
VSGAPRELPAHSVTVLGPRRHRHALVIPVINEGERIRRQLQAIAALSPPVDVVIADGGSTDGSLDPDFLRQTGVRALIVKTGPGRLSAQLRAGYAWCLDEGYEGVVTVDGNGKDGVEAIPRFVAALEEGYDYVQGSRYIPGGVAENTPPDRTIAGRLIHAPLISLAAGHRYTDTTNGFRAYSARYLSDPRVAPFRDVFDRYQLLFYLSVRAGQLGLRTTEAPVARRYPAGEATPTKISGFRGRLEMLGELWGAASGRFNP